MSDSDGVLSLLQDIKEMIFGAVLVLIGSFLCAAAFLWNSPWAMLPAIVGGIVAIAGLLYVHRGYTRHKAAAHKDP